MILSFRASATVVCSIKGKRHWFVVNFKIRKDQKMDNQQISDKCNSCRNSPYHQSMYFCNIRKKIRCSKLTKERINVSLQSAKVFMEEEKIV